MVHSGNVGINAGHVLTAVSDNLKVRTSDVNADLITCLKVFESISGPNDDSRVIYGEESVFKLITKRLKLESKPT